MIRLAAAALLFSATAAAAGTVADELGRCAAIADVPARLTCYDALMGGIGAAPPAGTAETRRALVAMLRDVAALRCEPEEDTDDGPPAAATLSPEEAMRRLEAMLAAIEAEEAAAAAVGSDGCEN